MGRGCGADTTDVPSTSPTCDVSITAQELHGLLSESADVLLLDLRSFLSFNQQRIRSSINVCVPTAILKRRGFSAALIEKAICRTTDRERFVQRAGRTIVLYDDANAGPDSLLPSLHSFLLGEALAQSVRCLAGGFAAYRTAFPEDCQSCPLASLLRCSAAEVRPPPKTLHTDTVLSAEPVLIIPNLYLGDETTAANHEALTRERIVRVLNAAKECENRFEHRSGLCYKRLDLLDNPHQSRLLQLLEEAFTFIDEARDRGEGVLVHCKAGQSRSVTIVLAYLMHKLHWSLQHAYAYVQQKKPGISPNLGFMGQLTSFEQSLPGRLAGLSLVLPSPPVVPDDLRRASDELRRAPSQTLTDPITFTRPLDVPSGRTIS